MAVEIAEGTHMLPLQCSLTAQPARTRKGCQYPGPRLSRIQIIRPDAFSQRLPRIRCEMALEFAEGLQFSGGRRRRREPERDRNP